MITDIAHPYPPMQPPLSNIEMLPRSPLSQCGTHYLDDKGLLDPSPWLFSYNFGWLLPLMMVMALDRTGIYSVALLPPLSFYWPNHSPNRCVGSSMSLSSIFCHQAAAANSRSGVRQDSCHRVEA